MTGSGVTLLSLALNSCTCIVLQLSDKKRCYLDDGSMLGLRQRRRPSIEPSSGSQGLTQETLGDVEWGGLQCEDIILLLLPALDVTIIVSLCILVSFSQLNATPQ